MYLRSSHEVSRQIFPSHEVFRTTHEMSDLIRIRIGSEGAPRPLWCKKNTPELYQTLASLGQSKKESPQAFLMKALDLRQQILFASSDESNDFYLQYDSEHIQRLFLRSVETGLQDESIRAKIRPFLKDPSG